MFGVPPGLSPGVLARAPDGDGETGHGTGVEQSGRRESYGTVSLQPQTPSVQTQPHHGHCPTQHGRPQRVSLPPDGHRHRQYKHSHTTDTVQHNTDGGRESAYRQTATDTVSTTRE